MGEGEAGPRAPGRGGGEAPPSAVTGAGCSGQSAPSRRGCGGRPSARAAQSVASPLPAKDPSAELQKFKTEPFLLCLDPFFNKILVENQFASILELERKGAFAKKCLHLPLCEGSRGKKRLLAVIEEPPVRVVLCRNGISTGL